MVVTTPISGWFVCGGERGPGVALLLGLARQLADATAVSTGTEGCFTYHFAGTSAHEFNVAEGNLGLVLTKRALERFGLEPANVRVW